MSRNADLRAQLERYEPRDAQERSYRERMLALLGAAELSPPSRSCDQTGDPFSRGHFQPGHFTASAFVLSPDSTALLLIFHGKLHRWLQPGGHVDSTDRDLLSAAQREIREEVGLADLPLAVPAMFDLDVHEIPPLKGDPAHAHFDVRFLFRARGLSFEAGSDAKAARWVPLEQIDEEISDRSVMRAVEKLRARALR